MFLNRIHSLLLALADPQGPAAAMPAPPQPGQLQSLLELADWHGVLPAVVENLNKLLAGTIQKETGGNRENRGCTGLNARLPGPGCIPLQCPSARTNKLNGGPQHPWPLFSLLSPVQLQGSVSWPAFRPEPAAWDWAAHRLRHRAALSLLLRQQAQQIVTTARQAGLPVLVLKGCDFADRLYPRPALRPFTDVDLLVPEAACEPLRQVLRTLGYQPLMVSMKHATGYGEESWRRDPLPGGLVELHWNLVNSPALRQGLSVRYEDLQIETDHGPLRPSAAATLLIAAVHGVASHGLDRLQALVDVAQAARGLAGPLDTAWLAEVAARTGAARALALALTLAGSALNDSACRELQQRLGHQAWVGRLLVSPAVVLRAHASRDSFRRSLLREWLKRT